MVPFERKFASFGHDVGSFLVVDQTIIRSVNNGPDVQTPLETRFRVTTKPDAQIGVPVFPAESTWTHEPEADLDEFSFKPDQISGTTVRAVGSLVSRDNKNVVFWGLGAKPEYGHLEERGGILGTVVTLQRQVSAEGIEFQPYIAR